MVYDKFFAILIIIKITLVFFVLFVYPFPNKESLGRGVDLLRSVLYTL